jgi:hypothetical protein
MPAAVPSKKTLMAATDRQRTIAAKKKADALALRTANALLISAHPVRSPKARKARETLMRTQPEIDERRLREDVAKLRKDQVLCSPGGQFRVHGSPNLQELHDRTRQLALKGEDGENLNRATHHLRLSTAHTQLFPEQIKPLSRTLRNQILNECGIGRDVIADHTDTPHLRAAASFKTAITFLSTQEAIIVSSDPSGDRLPAVMLHNTDTTSVEVHADGKGPVNQKAAKVKGRKKGTRKNRGDLTNFLRLQFTAARTGHFGPIFAWFNESKLEQDCIVIELPDFNGDSSPDNSGWLMLKKPKTDVILCYLQFIRHVYLPFVVKCQELAIKQGWPHATPPHGLLKADGDPKLLKALLIALGESPAMSEADAKRVSCLPQTFPSLKSGTV